MRELVVQRGQEQGSQLSRASGGRGMGNLFRAVKAERSEIQSSNLTAQPASAAKLELENV